MAWQPCARRLWCLQESTQEYLQVLPSLWNDRPHDSGLVCRSAAAAAMLHISLPPLRRSAVGLIPIDVIRNHNCSEAVFSDIASACIPDQNPQNILGSQHLFSVYIHIPPGQPGARPACDKTDCCSKATSVNAGVRASLHRAWGDDTCSQKYASRHAGLLPHGGQPSRHAGLNIEGSGQRIESCRLALPWQQWGQQPRCLWRQQHWHCQP